MIRDVLNHELKLKRPILKISFNYCCKLFHAFFFLPLHVFYLKLFEILTWYITELSFKRSQMKRFSFSKSRTLLEISQERWWFSKMGAGGSPGRVIESADSLALPLPIWFSRSEWGPVVSILRSTDVEFTSRLKLYCVVEMPL